MRAEISSGRKCTVPSRNSWHPPVCLNYKSESGCKYGDKCQFRHDEAHGQPSKTSKKKSVALLEDSYTICLCVSRFSSEKIFSTEEGEYWDQIAPSSFPRARGHHIKIRESKGPSRGIIQKCEPHERNPCAFGFEERAQDETLHQERCASRMSTGSQIRSKLRFTLLLNPGQRQHPRQNLQRSENSWLSQEGF